MTAAYENIPERVFNSGAGVERVRIGSAGLKASVPYIDSATNFLSPSQGSVVAVPAGTSRLVMTPREPLRTLSIELPGSPCRGQLFHVSAVGHPVAGITWRGSVVGGPASIPSGHTVVFQFNDATKQWLCVEK